MMGKIYNRGIWYVDSRVKNDSKLLKFVKLHPAIYDKNHKFHRNKQEREKIWKYIASSLQKPVSDCKERWLQLLKEYKKCQTILTLHEIIYDQINDCIKKDNRRKISYLEDIEDGVLSTLFTEPLNTPTAVDIGVQTVDFERENPESEDNFSDSICGTYYIDDYDDDEETDLVAEACSLQCCNQFFSMDDFHNDIVHPPDPFSIADFFYGGEDEDDYYNFFVDNNLNRIPELFDGVVGSLMDHLDEEACDEARGDIVKLLCERLRIQNEQRRN